MYPQSMQQDLSNHLLDHPHETVAESLGAVLDDSDACGSLRKRSRVDGCFDVGDLDEYVSALLRVLARPAPVTSFGSRASMVAI